MRRRTALKALAGVGSLAVAGSLPASARPEPYRPLGTVSIDHATEAVVDEDGETAYVAASTGFATVDVRDPTDPRILAEVRDPLADREGGPLREILDVKLSGDRLAVAGPANASGDELVGLALYDVADPASPERVAFHPTADGLHNVRFHGDVVYVASKGELILVDVADDDPETVGRWTPEDHDPAWADVDGLLALVHDLAVRGDRAYVAAWDAGTWILDVADPAEPTVVSEIRERSIEELAAVERTVVESLEMPGNHHAVAVGDDGDLLGINHEAWVIRSDPDEKENGNVELWDVSDETDPEKLATIQPPPSPTKSKSGVNTTSHNFDLHGDRLYTSWYEGGVKLHDVSDPGDPERLAWWRDPEDASFWTAQYATDRFFVASSRGTTPSAEGEGNAQYAGEGALYAFPNRAGEQRDPPPLTPSGLPDTTTTTTTTTQSPTSATTRTSTTRSATRSTTTDDATTSQPQPGFTPVATLAAIGATGALLVRRLRGSEE